MFSSSFINPIRVVIITSPKITISHIFQVNSVISSFPKSSSVRIPCPTTHGLHVDSDTMRFLSLAWGWYLLRNAWRGLLISLPGFRIFLTSPWLLRPEFMGEIADNHQHSGALGTGRNSTTFYSAATLSSNRSHPWVVPEPFGTLCPADKPLVENQVKMMWGTHLRPTRN